MPDERERNFDKVLGRHLRSSAASGQAAPSPAGAAPHRASCPDSETLAAYHERSLLPEQMNSWKEHIVGCAPCQSILAHLEATDEIPLRVSAEEVLAAQQTTPVLTTRSLETSPVEAASNPPRRLDAATPPKKSRLILLLRGARWRWLAPAGAIAASLLVWIALHENQPLPLPEMDGVQVARRESAPSSPSLSSAIPQEEKSSRAVRAKPQSAADQIAHGRSRADSEPGNPSQRLSSVAPVAPSKTLADKESGERKQKGSDATADSLTAEVRGDLDAKGIVAGALKKDEAQNQAANIQSQNQYNSNAPKVAGPAPLNQMQEKKMKSASAAPPPAPAPSRAPAVGGAVSNYRESASLELAGGISNPRLISPPGSTVIWRVGRAGLIEFSSDRGSSWTRQTSGVLTDLLAGSAPSAQICWIVGRVGAILLTTDAGAHWTLLSSPISDELGRIRATDALHATIWNTARTKSFETSDGGLTWKRVPAP